MTPSRVKRLLWIALAVGVAAPAMKACRSAPQPPAAPVDPGARLHQLEQLEKSLDVGPDVLGRGAFGLMLLKGDSAAAARLVDRALEAQPDQKDALLGKLLLARDRLDDAAVVETALALVRQSPRSAQAELAISLLEELLTTSPALDARIIEALSPLETETLNLLGTAAIRARRLLVRLHTATGDADRADAIRTTLGEVTAWTLVGPLGRYRLREFDAPSPFDSPAHTLRSSYEGSFGPETPRQIKTPRAILDLSEEPWRADRFEALVDLDVREGGKHIVALRGCAMADLFIDGERIVGRRTWPQRSPMRSFGAVALQPGHHRLRVRFTRSGANWLHALVAREDGRPASIAYSAPTAGSDTPPRRARAAPMPMTVAEQAAAQISKDVGDPVAKWMRVMGLALDDPERALDLLLTLPEISNVPLTLRLQADLISEASQLPETVRTSRVQKVFDKILELQPEHPWALFERLDAIGPAQRFEEAMDRLARVEEVVGARTPRVLVMRAEILRRRDPEGAARAVDLALELDPGRCSAASIRLGLADSRRELSVQRKLIDVIRRCSGGRAELARHLEMRGLLERALDVRRHLVEREPWSVSPRVNLARVLWAVDQQARAFATLEPMAAIWPRQARPFKELARLRELAGEDRAARDLRRQAVAINGGDVATARAVALDEGRELLDWVARRGEQVIEDYERSGVASEAEAVQVLDLGALQVAADGSRFERVHSIVQVLDKGGIDRYGELSLPSDAVPLKVRTIKADMTILDAEQILGKDSISLPALDVGDYVEYEYLRGVEARSVSLPGWQGGQFFFQSPGTPFFESSYEVRAVGGALKVDSHNVVDVAPPEEVDGAQHFRHVVRNSPPFVREPRSVSDAEILPWVEVGSGADQRAAMQRLADWVPLQTRATGEVHRFAAEHAHLPFEARLKAIIERLSVVVRGESGSLSSSAEAILASGRGNRLFALKAALDAVGISSRLAYARSFDTNPHPFLFPQASVYGRLVLRIAREDGSVMWMTSFNRHAPSGAIPQSLSRAEAWVLPEPGEQARLEHLPEASPADDRTEVVVTAEIQADGSLTGEVRHTVYGFAAASMRSRLEEMTEIQVRRMQEQQLGRTFRGVVLEGFRIEDSGDPALPLRGFARIKVPSFARKEGDALVFPANFGAANAGKRYLGRANRSTPLLLASGRYNTVQAQLRLPAGYLPIRPDPVTVEGDWGRHVSTWTFTAGHLHYDEATEIRQARVTPAQFGSFSRFVSDLDAAQQRELRLEPGPPPPAPSPPDEGDAGSPADAATDASADGGSPPNLDADGGVAQADAGLAAPADAGLAPGADAAGPTTSDMADAGSPDAASPGAVRPDSAGPGSAADSGPVPAPTPEDGGPATSPPLTPPGTDSTEEGPSATPRGSGDAGSAADPVAVGADAGSPPTTPVLDAAEDKSASVKGPNQEPAGVADAGAGEP